MTYKERLLLTNLIPISYWHEFLDIVFFFKAINGLIYIENDVLSVMSEATRVLIPKGFKTAIHDCVLFYQIKHTARAVTR